MKTRTFFARGPFTSGRRMLCAACAGLALFVTTSALARAEDPVPAAKPPVAQEGPQATRADIEALVEQLGNNDFRVRDQATNQLEGLGEKARAALEQAAKSSPSLETRWRAQQILRRLEGGGVSRLDPDVQPPAREPRRGQPSPPRRSSTQLGEMLRQLEKLQGEFDKAGGADVLRETLERLQKDLKDSGLLGRGGINPFMPGRRMPDPFRNGDTVELDGLKLIKNWWRGTVTLEVAGKTKTDPATSYTGPSLEEILKRNPALSQHPGMTQLKAKGEDPFASAREALRMLRKRNPGGFSNWPSGFVNSSSGVSVTQTPDGVTVKITEADKDGKPRAKEYTGASLDELKKQHPELIEKLKGVSVFRLHVGPTQIVRPGQGLRDMLERFKKRPVTPTPPSEAKYRGRARFGLGFARPELALAMHLGLPEGHGALVREVLPGSMAEGLGLKRHDILVRLGEWDVRDLKTLHEKLIHAADHPAEPFELEIIRRGARELLTR